MAGRRTKKGDALQRERDIANAVHEAVEPLKKRIHELEHQLQQERWQREDAAKRAESILRDLRETVSGVRDTGALSDAELVAMAAEVGAEGRPISEARRRMRVDLTRRGLLRDEWNDQVSMLQQAVEQMRGVTPSKTATARNLRYEVVQVPLSDDAVALDPTEGKP